MKEILQKINELAGYLQQRIAFYERCIKDNEAKSVRLEQQDEELVIKTNALLAREQRIGPAEAVLSLRGQAVQEKAEADALLKSVRKEKQEFADYLTAEKISLDKIQKQVAIDKSKAANDLLMIQKEWTGLKKEQESWKAKFIEEIKNKVR